MAEYVHALASLYPVDQDLIFFGPTQVASWTVAITIRNCTTE